MFIFLELFKCSRQKRLIRRNDGRSALTQKDLDASMLKFTGIQVTEYTETAAKG